jgi:hypothetical protein
VAEHGTRAPVAMTAPEPAGDSIPCTNALFEQPWWLDSVVPGAWDEVVVRRGDDVVARLPYAYRRQLGMTVITQPPFTQTLGPWLATGDGKYSRRLDVEMKLLGQLVELLPPCHYFRQCFATSLTNWLPFHWAGFRATVKYTYRIEDLSDLDRVKHGFQEHVRRGIRKAGNVLEVDHDLPLDELLRLDAETYARQGLSPPNTQDAVRRLDAACAKRNARRVLGAVDRDGRTHAALYVVWDAATLYALIAARDAQLQTPGATTLLYWEAIRLASEVSRVFDFEGSMMRPIEHFVRGFGGRQTPYFCVSKAGSAARVALGARSAREALGRRMRRG